MTCLLFLAMYLFTIKADNGYSMQGHVVGGGLTDISKFPHSVFLQVECDVLDSWICGSSVLTQMLVLTAAHCFEGINKQCQIEAMAGHESVDETPYLRHVKKIVRHEGYSRKTVRNDIAIGLLRKKLPLGPVIQRVMITEYFPQKGQLSIAGWGTVNDATLETSLILKSVNQYLVPSHVCKSLGDIDVGMFCASNSMTNRPSKGDSGSALVVEDGHQVGLVSFRTIAVPEVIVYSNTSHHYKWIYETVCKLNCVTCKNDSQI